MSLIVDNVEIIQNHNNPLSVLVSLSLFLISQGHE